MATQENLDQAQTLYVAYYARPGDPGGVEFWANEFANSSNTDAAVDAFGTSPEFASNYGDVVDDHPALVNRLYNQMFNRDGDANGVAFYVELLDSGEASLASIALDIANGATGQDRVTLDNKIAAADTYTNAIGEDGLYGGDDIPEVSERLAAVTDDPATVDAFEAGNADDIGNNTGETTPPEVPPEPGQTLAITSGEAAGLDSMRITGDQTLRIDFTDVDDQVEGVDLNGNGIIDRDGVENNSPAVMVDGEMTAPVGGFGSVDAYPRDKLNDFNITDNYKGDINFDGTGYGGDGTNTNGNVVLGGLGVDTVLGGIGNDFLTGGGVAQGRFEWDLSGVAPVLIDTKTGAPVVSSALFGVAGFFEENFDHRLDTQDYLFGGRNADFFFVELSLLDNTDGNNLFIDGGSTSDDRAPDASDLQDGGSNQDFDWILLEASDDDEPVFIDLDSFFGGTDVDDDYQTLHTQTWTMVTLRDIENIDASGNLYGFIDGMEVALGDQSDPSAGVGIGSTAQIDYDGSEETNIFIGGYDNDRVDGDDGDDILMGGNMAYADANPNIADIINDGVDEIYGGEGNDHIVFEMDGGILDGESGIDTLWITDQVAGRLTVAEMTLDNTIRIDLGNNNTEYQGYGGDGFRGTIPTGTGTDSELRGLPGTHDQTDYNTPFTLDGPYPSTDINDFENVNASGLGALDFVPTGNNGAGDLVFNNPQNYLALDGVNLELRGTDGENCLPALPSTSLDDIYAGATDSDISEAQAALEDQGIQVSSGTFLFNSAGIWVPLEIGQNDAYVFTDWVRATVLDGGQNELIASNGDDILEGRTGNDFLQGGNGNDDFLFNLGNDSVFIADSSGDDLCHTNALEGAVLQGSADGDHVDVIGRRLDLDGDNIWDTFPVAGISDNFQLIGRDFGLDQEALASESELVITIVNTLDVLEVREVAFFLEGVEYGVAAALDADLDAATTIGEVAAALDANLSAQNELISVGFEATSGDAVEGKIIVTAEPEDPEAGEPPRFLRDTDTEFDPDSVLVAFNTSNSGAASTSEEVIGGVSEAEDRIIFKAYEDRADNEGVDDDAITGSSIALGVDSYAQDMVVAFGVEHASLQGQKDGPLDFVGATVLAEDQLYKINFRNLTTEDKVTIDVNGVHYCLQVGIDLDGNTIIGEDTVHTDLNDVQSNFLNRMADYINSFGDDDTAAGQVGAAFNGAAPGSAGGSTIAIFQRTYNGEETVFMHTPVITLENLSGGERPQVAVTDTSGTEVTIVDYDGRGTSADPEDVLDRENVLFWGQEEVNRSVLEVAIESDSADPTELIGMDSLVINSGDDDIDGVDFNQATEFQENFTVHGDDLLIGSAGDDIIWGRTGDDRVIGTAGDDVLDGGLDWYLVHEIGDDEDEGKLEQHNVFSADDRDSDGEVLSIVRIPDMEGGWPEGLNFGDSDDVELYEDTLQYEQAHFDASSTQFTIVLDDYEVGSDSIDFVNGGAGQAFIDVDGDGEAEFNDVFTNFEHIRTVSGTGKATADDGQGRDTLDVSELSTDAADDNLSYDSDPDDVVPEVHHDLRYWMVSGAQAGKVDLLEEDGDTSFELDYTFDGTDGGDYAEKITIDGVENLLGGEGDDALYIDETEAAKDNLFDGGGDGDDYDLIVYANSYDGGEDDDNDEEPSVTLTVEDSNNTDTVVMTGGRVGAVVATDTLIDVESMAFQCDTLCGPLEDVLDVSNLSNAVVDFREYEIDQYQAGFLGDEGFDGWASISDGSNLQLLVEADDLDDFEIIIGGSGDDEVIMSDKMDNCSDGGESLLEFDSVLNFDILDDDDCERRDLDNLRAEDDEDLIARADNYGTYQIMMGAGSDLVDYSDSEDTIVAGFGINPDTLDATVDTVMVFSESYADFDVSSDTIDRVDFLESVENIAASQGDSVIDLTQSQISVKVRYNADDGVTSNDPSLDRDVYRIQLSELNSTQPIGGVNLLEYADAGDFDGPDPADTITQPQASWNVVEGSDNDETIEMTDHDSTSEHFFNLRGGDNEVNYNELTKSIELTLSVFNQFDPTGAEDAIFGEVEFTDGDGSSLEGGMTDSLASYAANNKVAGGTLRIEASQDAEDCVTFDDEGAKLFIVGQLIDGSDVVTVQLPGTDIGSVELTGFEFLKDDADSDDVYDMRDLDRVINNLTLVDGDFGSGFDRDTAKVYDDAVGETDDDTIYLYTDINAPLDFAFRVLDVTGVTDDDLILVGDPVTEGIGIPDTTTDPFVPGGSNDGTTRAIGDQCVVVGDLGLIDEIIGFDSIIFTDDTEEADFVLDLTAGELQDGDGDVLSEFDGFDLDFSRITDDRDITVDVVGGAAVITGAGGADTITGAGGDDIITGGAGADMLDGGVEAETVAVATYTLTGALGASDTATDSMSFTIGNGVADIVLDEGDEFPVDADIDQIGSAAGAIMSHPDWATMELDVFIDGVAAPGTLASAAIDSVVFDPDTNETTVTFAPGVTSAVDPVLYDADGSATTLDLAFVDIVDQMDSEDTFVYLAHSDSSVNGGWDVISNFSIDANNPDSANDTIDLSALDFDFGTSFTNGGDGATDLADAREGADSAFASGFDIYIEGDGTDAWFFVNTDGSAFPADHTDDELVIELAAVGSVAAFDFDNFAT